MKHDVRMRGFQHRTEVDAALKLLDERTAALPAERISLQEACGRVLAADVISDVAVPPFARAAMDGYALKADETFSAGAYNPLEFTVIGQSLPGRPFDGVIHSGQAVRIMTGAPLPSGADAVLQAEATEEIPACDKHTAVRVRITDSVPPAKNVGKIGEDIQIGKVVLTNGRVLRPQDVGVLASIGASPIEVIRRPRVAVLVTGDELLPCGSKPHGYQIVDSNSVMLRGLIQRDGGIPIETKMLPDNYEVIRSALEQATEEVILISGGSSVGVEDHAPRIVSELGELAVHGVALRPASPTGIGFMGNRIVFLIPGNPVSALCTYDLFAGRVIRKLGGRSWELPYPKCTLPLGRKISSVVGRVDYVRVKITDEKVEPLAISGASILSSTTRADGFAIIPADLEGYAPGEQIKVYLYDDANAEPSPGDC